MMIFINTVLLMVNLYFGFDKETAFRELNLIVSGILIAVIFDEIVKLML